ncbi:hypothetical protein NUU61_006681 [Penicillium alfredii]|uniref:Uncharacterized protein n=1 Tax=Penicillium alfredii TaxID=1506179 RepID=A0A9W9F1M3_9EURO|nr:uncharacterized protein NUU61_006681 [Penicillium alfredii]KAJ5091811.1 hypothetical protein NUU61_006681 [Penicillium alfredii]
MAVRSRLPKETYAAMRTSLYYDNSPFVSKRDVMFTNSDGTYHINDVGLSPTKVQGAGRIQPTVLKPTS